MCCFFRLLCDAFFYQMCQIIAMEVLSIVYIIAKQSFFFTWQQQQTINIQHTLMLAYYHAVAVFIVTICSVGVVGVVGDVVVVFEM